MTEPTIYLCGPIDKADDPYTWRDDVKDEYPHLSFADPAERYPDYNGREKEVVEWGLKQARSHPVLVENTGEDGPETVGTHHEIAVACEHGNKVAVVPEGDQHPFVEERDQVYLADDRDDAIEYLLNGGLCR